MTTEDRFYNWEEMSLSQITHLMVKWFDYQLINTEVRERGDVESGVWYDIKIEKHRPEGLWYVSGSRPDIIRRRLIEFLDGQKVREDYLKKRVDNINP